MSDLASLKPGDKAIVRRSAYCRGSEEFSVVTVVSVSPTGRIKTDDGLTFNADGGVRPEPKRGSCRLYPNTPEHANPARFNELKKLVARAAEQCWYTWSLAKLERVWAAINAEETPT